MTMYGPRQDSVLMIRGTPSTKIMQRLMDLHMGMAPVVVWSRGPERVFALTRITRTLPWGKRAPEVELTFRQCASRSSGEQIFDDREPWITEVDGSGGAQ